jgi:UDP-N-acetylmuramate dehydrogenase
MSIEHQTDFPLQPHNTFGIPAYADRWYAVLHPEDLNTLYAAGIFKQPHLILGGGSNVLLVSAQYPCVIHIAVKGWEIVAQGEETIDLTVAAGEPWHEWVMTTLQHNWGGLENLSLIPGYVGAAPIQNIGAYGVEVKDTIIAVEVFDKQTGTFATISGNDCAFGYRYSRFKSTPGLQLIIVSVTFRLHQPGYHQLNLSYGAILSQLEAWGKQAPYSIQDVSQAVVAIRQSKLPDPAVLGNAGSFFKNPVISAQQMESLRAIHPDIVHYPAPNGEFKIAAGWLIERAGWKGMVIDQVGMHQHQALVLVNYSNASGQELYQHALSVQADIAQQFGILLEMEVNIVQ